MLDRITAPTLILHGRYDRVAPLSCAEETQRGIRDSDLQVFTGGHLFFAIAARGRFLEALTAWLEAPTSS